MSEQADQTQNQEIEIEINDEGLRQILDEFNQTSTPNIGQKIAEGLVGGLSNHKRTAILASGAFIGAAVSVLPSITSTPNAGADIVEPMPKNSSDWAQEEAFNPGASQAQIAIDVQESEQASHITNPRLVLDGQQVTIITPETAPAAPEAVTPAPTPAAVAPTPAPAPTEEKYTVVAGDSLYRIAGRFGTTYQVLAARNNIPDPSLIHPGEILDVGSAPAAVVAAAPEATPTPPTTVAAVPAPAPTDEKYTVVAGDSLYKIAGRFGTTYNVLAARNNIPNPNLIHIGDVLDVGSAPAAVVAAAPEATPAPTTSPAPTPAAVPSPPPVQHRAEAVAVSPETGLPGQNYVLSPEAIANSGNTPGPNFIEQYNIAALNMLAVRLGISPSITVTPANLIVMTAWEIGEGGDIENQDLYNLLNTGIDDPSLLATANSGDGVQAFKSFTDGVEGLVETLMSPYQSRLKLVLTTPGDRSVDFMNALAHPYEYAGDHIWAMADTNNPAEGWSVQSYFQTLVDLVSKVQANYAYYATLVIGTPAHEQATGDRVNANLLQLQPASASTPATVPATPAAPEAQTTPPVTTTPAPKPTNYSSPAQSQRRNETSIPASITSSTAPTPASSSSANESAPRG